MENKSGINSATYDGITVDGIGHSGLLKLNQLIESKTTRDEVSSHKNTPPLRPKIQRVLPILVSDQTHLVYYQPKWISIGPIHHGSKNLKLPGEQYKLEFAATFVENSGYRSSDRLYYEVVKTIEINKKEWFEEEVIKPYNEGELAWMLFVDGCFILQFIYSIFNNASGEGEGEGEFKTCALKADQIAFVCHDLFLLENQIPFEVLNLLIYNSDGRFGMKLKKCMWKFIHSSVMTFQKKITSKSDLHEHVHHLLDFLRLELIHQSDDESTPHQSESFFLRCVRKFRPQTLENNTIPVSDVQRHDKLKRPQNQTTTGHRDEPEDDDSKSQQFFRSVTDLKAAGIYLKPSKSSSLRNVKFSTNKLTAELELPALLLDDSTAPKFLNLIAYEMCPDNTNTNYEVTSFVSLLDSLIDYATDVKELRMAKVLHNCLGSDKEVAKIFNHIARYLVPNCELYVEVVNQIEKHYMNNVQVWIAQFLNDHFSSPWTVLSFLGAVLIIILSIFQTWFTIYSPPGPCDDFCKKL